MEPIRGPVGNRQGKDGDEEGLGHRLLRRTRSATNSDLGGVLRGSWARSLLVVLGSFLFGYVLATWVLFPAPEPPGDLVSVPDLRGLGLDEAEVVLRQSGLMVGILDSVKHPAMAAGRVFGQDPLPGQLQIREGAVRLAVSQGAELFPIPDVSGLASSQAIGLLESSGFQVVMDSVESRELRGSVVDVTPPAGARVQLPQVVHLDVSLGPPTVHVPRLIGLTEEEAVMALDSLGLTVSEVEVRFRFGLDQGRVIEQEPPSGREVEQGSSVRLVVGRRARAGGGNE